jgi:uncharacterized protein
MRKNILILPFILLSLLNLNSCSSNRFIDTHFFSQKAASLRQDTPSTQLEEAEFWQANPGLIWAKLQQTPFTKLSANANIEDTNKAAWIKLALLSKSYSESTSQLVQALLAWRNQYPQHVANDLFANNYTLNKLLSAPAPKHIALLLPLQGPYASLGQAVRDGFLNAYFVESAKTSQQQIINFYDTSQNVDIATLYNQALAKGADMIIGPLVKENVQKLLKLNSFTQPVIALNYTDIAYGTLPNNFYQFGLSPIDEAKQIADKAWQIGNSKALIIGPNDEWGMRVIKALKEQWQANGGSISDIYYFSAASDFSQDIPQLLHINVQADHAKTRDSKENNKALLESQRRQDFDVIFLLASPDKARTIVPLLRYYYVNNDIPIYATSMTYSGNPMPQKDNDLNGIIFCDIPALIQNPDFSKNNNARLFAVGQDAYLITHELNRFISLPNFPAYGATGALSLNPQHQFYRRLAWAQFHDGHP